MPCPARYEGIRAGVIWWSQGMRKWLCLNHLGVPVATLTCPWCGKGMPTEVSVGERIATMNDVDFQRLLDGGENGEGSEV